MDDTQASGVFETLSPPSRVSSSSISAGVTTSNLDTSPSPGTTQQNLTLHEQSPNVLSAEHAFSPGSSSSSSSTSVLTSSAPDLPSSWPPVLDMLVGMGFPRNASLHALYHTSPPFSSPSPAIAANWLAEHLGEAVLEQPFILPNPTAPPRALSQTREAHKLVMVVNMGLQMGKGKIAAQCAHAAVDVVLSYPQDIKDWMQQAYMQT
eukprot:g36858.t1